MSTVVEDRRAILRLMHTGARCLITEFTPAEFGHVVAMSREGLIEPLHKGAVRLYVSESGIAWMNLPEPGRCSKCGGPFGTHLPLCPATARNL